VNDDDHWEKQIKGDKNGGAYSMQGKFIEYSVRNSKTEMTTLEIKV
jgi:hypothetical protein